MSDIKQLRAIGARLNPAVTIGSKGLTAELISEADRRLNEHELIKIRSQIRGRDQNAALFLSVSDQLQARLVQVMGRTALISRPATGDKPKNSNLKGDS